MMTVLSLLAAVVILGVIVKAMKVLFGAGGGAGTGTWSASTGRVDGVGSG